MRLALHQGPSPAGDIDAAFAALDRLLASAAASGADIALAPELFLPGYNVTDMDADPGWGAQLSALAARHRTPLVLGLAERSGDRLLNAAHAYGADGTLLARYAKRQLFGPREAALFTPGEDLVTFSLNGHTFGLLICYDIEFAELARVLAGRGCDTLLVPTANMTPFDTVSRFIVPAQSAMYGITVAYANYCGTEGDLTYCGGSLVTGPDGDPLVAAGTHPALLIADLPDRGASTLRPISTQREDFRPL